MSKACDIRPEDVSLYFLPIATRMPLKFGAETMTSVTCARVCMRVKDRQGCVAEGWGETPLSVQWVWPSTLSCEFRLGVLKEFSTGLCDLWRTCSAEGHPVEIGHEIIFSQLPHVLETFNRGRGDAAMPWLAALVCCSAFDIALHDAYGVLHDVPVYETYGSDFMGSDLSRLLEPAEESCVDFGGTYPSDYLVRPHGDRLPAWHLVGGKDPIREDELTGEEPRDGYPVLLEDWIDRDGLRCLKVKLRGTDETWDYTRMVEVGRMAVERGVLWLSADFNCTVTDPSYVNGILDRLMAEHPRIYGMILYVEQPFPYDLEAHRLDVRSVSARKPLFMDESAHDWRMVKLGRSLGWTGVALKTCKTQTGALLSLCWARAHGMTVMVQDLTNPMLAQIPHVLLALHAGTIMGVETNAVQFYPEASKPEAAVHPGLYERRGGDVDLSSVSGPGFGYRIDSIDRPLPAPAVAFASA